MVYARRILDFHIGIGNLVATLESSSIFASRLYAIPQDHRADQHHRTRGLRRLLSVSVRVGPRLCAREQRADVRQLRAGRSFARFYYPGAASQAEL